MSNSRVLTVHNRHGMFQGDVDKVDMILRAFDDVTDGFGTIGMADPMQSYMNELGPSNYNDVTNPVELAVMIADVTPHKETFEEYRILANYEMLRGLPRHEKSGRKAACTCPPGTFTSDGKVRSLADTSQCVNPDHRRLAYDE